MENSCAKAEAVIDVLKNHGITFTEKEICGIREAFATRGKYKGYLKKVKPSYTKNPFAAVAWLAIQPNPYKLSTAAAFSFYFVTNDEETKNFYMKLTKLPNGEPILYPFAMDKDAETLKMLGAW